MVNSINVQELLTRVRQRIHDNADRSFDITEKLTAADDVMRVIFTRVRQAGESHAQDTLDVTPSQFTTVEPDVIEYDLPEYVSDVQLVQTVQQSGVPPIPIPRGSFEDMDAARGVFTSDNRRWIFNKYGNAGTIQIRGRAGTYTAIRIWYAHSWGPLHFGTASAGTTTSITAGVTSGNYKNRPNLYDGMQLEITADTGQPTNVGVVRRILSFTGGVYTLQTALPAVANATTQYALVIPLPPETHTYFIESVVEELLHRDGNMEELSLRAERMRLLDEQFEKAIGDRASGEPTRFTCSRMFR